MPVVVGVRFKPAGKTYYFAPGMHKLLCGETVIVETARGLEMGEAVIEVREVPEKDLVLPLKRVIRKATASDLAQAEENKQKEKAAFTKCRSKIKEHRLDMKLVEAEYTFDRNKIIFYFTSEERVDFRELVKDLASIFKTRIELRQIGVRDEAKLKGGVGPCGRPFCCTTFLEEFEPVSIRMAKGQNLSLNPTKISGACGRLMCCLRFEANDYKEARAEMPRPGDLVVTTEGEGKLAEINRAEKNALVVMQDTGISKKFPMGEVKKA